MTVVVHTNVSAYYRTEIILHAQAYQFRHGILPNAKISLNSFFKFVSTLYFSLIFQWWQKKVDVRALDLHGLSGFCS